MKIEVTNVSTLTKDLLSVYNALRNGEIKPSEVHMSTIVAGKVFSGIRTTLLHNKMTGTAPGDI